MQETIFTCLGRGQWCGRLVSEQERTGLGDRGQEVLLEAQGQMF